MIFCHFCGSKISDNTISKRRLKSAVGLTPRWINFYKCNSCGKHFDYRLFLKHKKIFKKILKSTIETYET